jgi:hypothetical protein
MSLKRQLERGGKQQQPSPGKALEELLNRKQQRVDDKRTEKREQIFNSIFRQSLYEE